MAELPPIDQHLEKEHQEKTKVKNIQCVEMGKYEVSTLCTCGSSAQKLYALYVTCPLAVVYIQVGHSMLSASHPGHHIIHDHDR